MTSISIGIPSYEAGESLSTTIGAIFAQSCIQEVHEIILVLDGGPAGDKIPGRTSPKLKIIRHPERRGQAAGINTILQRASGDWVVLTNDDVLLAPDSVEKLTQRAIHGPYAVTAGHTHPLPPGSLLERLLQAGHQIGRSISAAWNSGNNYLACNGRLLALSRDFAARLRLPDNLWNCDAFIYLTAAVGGDKFAVAEDAHCWFKDPSRISEFLRQTWKFQNSAGDNQRYFNQNILPYFQLPVWTAMRATIRTMAKRPVNTSGYFALAAYARLCRAVVSKELPARGFWESDRSTKLALANPRRLDGHDAGKAPSTDSESGSHRESKKSLYHRPD